MFYLAVLIVFLLVAAVAWCMPIRIPVKNESLTKAERRPCLFEKIIMRTAVLLSRIFSGGKKNSEQKWKIVLIIVFLGDVMALLLWIKGEEESKTIFLLGLFTAGGIWFLYDRELRRKEEERQKQMMTEYAAIVSKLTLYLGAGMNLRRAFERTAKDGRKTDNPVYAEMQLACGEMADGISEAESYIHFGKRTRLQRYIRLGTLLAQNLKKGNAILLVQLKQEALLSMEEQRAEVRKTGEEMGTKLLLPMILMMGMTMVLIMVPAFLSL